MATVYRVLADVDSYQYILADDVKELILLCRFRSRW